MKEIKKTIVSDPTEIDPPVSFQVLTLWDDKSGRYKTTTLPCFGGVPEENYPIFLKYRIAKEDALQMHENIVKVLKVNPGYINICASLSAIPLKQNEVFIHESLRNPVFHQPQLHN